MNTNQIKINSSQTKTVVSITISIPSGHTGVIVPLTFGANIDCNPCSGGATGYVPYFVYWYLNNTQIGYTLTDVAQFINSCGGCPPEVSFGLPNNGDQAFLSTQWSGPTTLVYRIDVLNAFPTSITSTLELDFSYANLYLAQT